MSRLTTLLCALTLAMPGAAATPPRTPDTNGASLYDRVLPATVWIVSFTDRAKGKCEVGTGVLIDRSRRLVLTAYHCVDERPEATVFFARRGRDGRILTDPKAYTSRFSSYGITGKVVARSKSHDLAVLRLARLDPGVRALRLAPASPRPGELLHCIGNSGSQEGTLWRYSSGRVRQVYVRRLSYKSGQKVKAMMVETQIPTNSGDSGGPWVNERGEVVAIVTGGGAEQLVEYGIDVSVIRALKVDGRPLDSLVSGFRGFGTRPATPTWGAPSPRPERRPWKVPSSRQPAWGPAPARPAVPLDVPKPRATVRNAKVLHGVTRGGMVGMQVTCDVVLDGLRGIPCQVQLTVCDRTCRPYVARQREFHTERGQLGVGQAVVARDHRDRVNGVVLFIPYQALDNAVPSRDTSLQLSVEVFSLASTRVVSDKPWWTAVQRALPGPLVRR